MDTLFSEDPLFVRSQYQKLSDNVKEWSQEISDLVSQKLPKGMGLTPTVVFQNTDDERGYATGSAIVTDGQKRIGIPIIVKAWHLAPIDMFFQDEKFYPLTDDNIAKAMLDVGIGNELVSKTPPPQLADDAFSDIRNPPPGGRYSYASAGSVMGLLAGGIDKKDGEKFRDAIEKTGARILPAFAKRGTFETLRGYAKLAAEDGKDAKPEDVGADLADRTFMVKKDGFNSYRLYSAPDDVYDPVVIATDRKGVGHWLNVNKATLSGAAEDVMNELDRNGHYVVEAPRSNYGESVEGGSPGLGERRDVRVFDPHTKDKLVISIEKFGNYGVRDKDGVLAKGWVIPNVVDFNGSPVSTKLFISRTLSSIQGRIAGIPLAGNADSFIRPGSPDAGKMGTLFYQDESGKAFATVPFQITAVTVFNGTKSISVVDYKGNKANLIFAHLVKGIVKVEKGEKSGLGPLLGPKENYIVSSDMVFIPMPRLSAVSETADDFKKLVVDQLDTSPVKVAMVNEKYVFRGNRVKEYSHADRRGSRNGFQKAAFDFNSLDRHEAKFLLISWGLGQEKTADILDGVKKAQTFLEVHNANLPPTKPMAKTATDKHITEALKSISERVKLPVEEALKIASVLDTAQSADVVLGLGFLNQDNVERLSSMIPMLTELNGGIAKILLASRLSKSDIPEDAARQAMVSIQRLIDGLTELKMLKEAPQKTASIGRTRPSLAPVPSWFSV